MAKIDQIKDIRHYPLFALVLIVAAIGLSRLTWMVTERTLLPIIYQPAKPTAEPLRMVDRNGLLSDGHRLTRWKKFAFTIPAGVLWMAAMVVFMHSILRVWPSKATPNCDYDPPDSNT